MQSPSHPTARCSRRRLRRAARYSLGRSHRRAPRSFAGHSGAVVAAVFSPDGRTFYTASFPTGPSSPWTPAARADLDGRSPLRGVGRHVEHFRGRTRTAPSSPCRPRPQQRSPSSTRARSTPTGRTLTGPTGNMPLRRVQPRRRARRGDRGRPRGRIWNASTGARTRTVRVGPHGSDDVAFSPDGRELAVAEADDAVRLVSLRTGATRDLPSKGSPGDVDFSPDGKLLASASLDGTVTLWDVAAKSAVRSLSGPVAAYSVAVLARRKARRRGRQLRNGGPVGSRPRGTRRFSSDRTQRRRQLTGLLARRARAGNGRLRRQCRPLERVGAEADRRAFAERAERRIGLVLPGRQAAPRHARLRHRDAVERRSTRVGRRGRAPSRAAS